jgi:hypothetical protein
MIFQLHIRYTGMRRVRWGDDNEFWVGKDVEGGNDDLYEGRLLSRNSVWKIEENHEKS